MVHTDNYKWPEAFLGESEVGLFPRETDEKEVKSSPTVTGKVRE